MKNNYTVTFAGRGDIRREEFNDVTISEGTTSH